MEIIDKINKNLNTENFRRMKTVTIVFIFLGITLLIVDYSSLNPWDKNIINNYRVLDISFTTLSIMVSSYFWCAKNTNTKLNNIVVKITIIYLVLWSILVCSLDFYGFGFSTYIAVLLLSLLYFNFKPAFCYALIWISTLILIIIMYFNSDTQSEFIPLLLVLIPINVIATLISYHHYKEKLASLKIFYENEKLNQELKLAKENLALEVDKKTKNLIATNIELSKSKNSIKLEKDRFEALINQLQQGVLYLNTKGDIIEVNRSIIKIMGSPSIEATKSINILNFPPLIKYGFTKNYQKCIDSCKITNGNGLYKTKWGIELFVEYYFVPIMENDKIVGVLSCLEDYTDKKRIENELVLAKEKAEESNNLKSAFLSNMSHEIRTPMNGILGFLNLLSDKNLNEQNQKKYIEIINKSGQRLLNTINNIIDISKIDSNETKLLMEKVDLAEIIRNLKDFFQIQCTEKGLNFIISRNLLNSPLIIQSDKVKLESIFTNLIKNAIKYTNTGTILIGVNFKDDYWEFFIKDTGIGVPENRKNAIFDRFVQADIEDKNALQGSGLGLAITKSYVEMLGGKIWVQSEIKEGSTFIFTLPIIDNIKTIKSEKTVTDIDSLSLKNRLKILIAEDDEISFEYLSTLLKEYDCEIIHCKNGKDVVNRCKTINDIDLILMDIKMPKMNGYDATKEIRKFNKNVYILFQSAHAFSMEKEKAISSGGNEYITKPIDKNKLFDIINHVKEVSNNI